MPVAKVLKKGEGQKPLTFEQKIWDVFYRVRLHAFDSRTLEDIKANGVMVTGIPELDDGLKNDWIKHDITISQMVDLHRRGVTIRLVNSEESRQIYEVIEEYLARSIDYLKVGLNHGDAPLEDFMAMDKLAHAVYAHAKHHGNKEELENLWAARLNAVQPINMSNLFTTQAPQLSREDFAEQEKKNVRVGYGKELRDSAIALRRYQV